MPVLFISTDLISMMQVCHAQMGATLCHALLVLLAFEKFERLAMALQRLLCLTGDEKPVAHIVEAQGDKFGFIQFPCQFFSLTEIFSRLLIVAARPEGSQIIQGSPFCLSILLLPRKFECLFKIILGRAKVAQNPVGVPSRTQEFGLDNYAEMTGCYQGARVIDDGFALGIQPARPFARLL